MSEIIRKYVIPGDLLVEGNYNTYGYVLKINDKFYSTKVGLAEINRDGVRVIPFLGPYTPRIDDLVIGKIIDYSAFGWDVDINSCFFASLPAQSVFGRNFSPDKDSLLKKLSIGDLIYARISAYDRTRNPLLNISEKGLGQITKGILIKISPAKVPRLIGKKGSMIKMIEAVTKSKLTIGQNGLILVQDQDINTNGFLLVSKAIKLIESEAHSANLMNDVQELLSKYDKSE